MKYFWTDPKREVKTENPLSEKYHNSREKIIEFLNCGIRPAGIANVVRLDLGNFLTSKGLMRWAAENFDRRPRTSEELAEI